MFSRCSILFAGGGTAGHIAPGLAVAEEIMLRRPDATITFITSEKPNDLRLVKNGGFHCETLNAPRSPGRSLKRWVRLPYELHRATRDAMRILREHEASVVVGSGGYVALPVCQAAKKLRLPLLLMEQNAIPGRTTRIASRWADVVCMPMHDRRLSTRATQCETGVPVRKAFLEARETAVPFVDRKPPYRLIVLGGSAGAHKLNTHVPKALWRILESDPSIADQWQVIHQTGANDFDDVRAYYETLPLQSTVEAFIDDVPSMLRECDLAISRAGAMVSAELATVGVPTVFVPYPHAMDDHQLANATHAAQAGGAITVEEGERFSVRLRETLEHVMADAQLRAQMAHAMRQQATPEAAQSIAETILAL